MNRFFITGGTGFWGKSILDYRRRHLFNADGNSWITANLTLLSRDPDRFCREVPELVDQPGITFVRGDIRSFEISDSYDAILHLATSAVTTISDDEQTSVILDGTRHVIDLAQRWGVSKILFASSGAVYGPQTSPVNEETPCAPTTAYGKAKLSAERMLVESGLDVKIARGFAFTGAYLNQRIHFAIGNFIRSVLENKPIVIKGDGTPQRSYLYADDLVEWLFTVLAKGVSGRPYNIGSGEGLSIRDLAEIVRTTLGGSNEIHILGEPTSPPYAVYVPCIDRARYELNLVPKVDLSTAIRQSCR